MRPKGSTRGGRAASRLDHISEPLRKLAVPIGTLRPDPRNARRHPERNLAAIAESLKTFGQQAPIVYVVRDGKRTVVKGSGLLAAARTLGWKTVAAVESGLSGPAVTAFAIADNRTSDLSEFDAELLAAQLQELEEAEYDIASTGFSDAELQELIEQVEEPPGAVGRPPGADRKHGERTALFVVGPIKFEIPRAAFHRWMTAMEDRVGADV